jgi:hypothetical protein
VGVNFIGGVAGEKLLANLITIVSLFYWHSNISTLSISKDKFMNKLCLIRVNIIIIVIFFTNKNNVIRSLICRYNNTVVTKRR